MVSTADKLILDFEPLKVKNISAMINILSNRSVTCVITNKYQCMTWLIFKMSQLTSKLVILIYWITYLKIDNGT